MAWFDEKAAGGLAPAHFEDVTQRQRKQPSWLCHDRRNADPVAVSLPYPPLVPADMAGAVCQQVAIPTGNPAKHSRQDTREPAHSPAAEPSRPSMSPAELESLVAERAARKAVEQKLESGRSAVADALQRIETAHNLLADELTRRAVDLAMLVARRVIARELRIQQDIVVGLVREALDVLNSRDRVRVHLGREFAVMQSTLVAHYSAMGTLIDVTVDDDLPEYGCVVETDVGSVDESIDSRLAALLEGMSENEVE